ncbi:MAG: hemolysin family protein [Alphaproteobacteria bacterium]|nr:hemolysin family protein [Alphaproteobacteria bacterium]
MFKRSRAREKIVELISNQDSATDQIDSRERELISNILSVRDVSVANIMTPRGEIIGVDINQKTKDILEFIAREQHSRYPLYSETLDNIIGTIHVKSIYAWLLKIGGKIPDSDQNFMDMMKDLINQPIFVAPSMRVLDLLLAMRQQRNHIAFVVDEYGGIDGLVTIEDALEEIVGSIEDEYDDANDSGIIQHKDGSITLNGTFKLEEFQQKFGFTFTEEESDEDFDTIGGLIIWLAGHVPIKGELIKWRLPNATSDKKMEFEIIRSLPNRVITVKLHSFPVLINEK